MTASLDSAAADRAAGSGQGSQVAGQMSETERLKACINDLVGLSGLRTLLSDSQPEQVARVLATVLHRMLAPDFVLLRLFSREHAAPVTIFMADRSADPSLQGPVEAEAERWIQNERRFGSQTWTAAVAGKGTTLLATDLGAPGDYGFILVGASRPTFPEATDRLLLSVAASQALIALHEQKLLEEQKRLAAELDRLVKARTSELEATNIDLLRSEMLMTQGEALGETGSFRWRAGSDDVQWSTNARALLGLDVDEAVDLKGFIAWVTDERRADLAAALDPDTLKREAQDLRVALDLPHRGQCFFRIVACASPLANSVDYFGTLQDITSAVTLENERALSEIRMRELRDNLAHAGRLSTLGQFSAAIAHDVCQPLSSVSACALAGRNWLTGEKVDVAAAIASLDRILGGVQRAADTLGRIKAYGRRSTDRVPVDLNQLVSDTIMLVDADAAGRGVALNMTLADDPAFVIADRVQIQQVLMNLLTNALDALDDRRASDGRISLRVWRDGADVSVEVADNGPGLPHPINHNLFETFYTTKATGLGMGLSICRNIISDHEGRIWAEPASEGAIFSFALPASDRKDTVDAP